MFKKPLAHQSNATPIRSSARRQLISAILGQYPQLAAGKDEEGQRELSRQIVPEGIRQGTFETSGGVEGVSLLQGPTDTRPFTPIVMETHCG